MDQKQISSLNLQQLVDIYERDECLNFGVNKERLLLHILTHLQIKPSLKTQAHILKRIFNYQNLSILINYLKQQNPEDATLIKSIKYDPSGQIIPLCLKLPFMAMEILCCECQIINELLFCGDGEGSPPLLPKLLSFLDHKPHYHLACYFSKVICTITKRISSTGKKYNTFFTTQVFGQIDDEALEKSYLFKSIKHFYSLTTFDFITRWLLMSKKQIQKMEFDSQVTQKTVMNFKKPLKLRFLLKLVEIVNKNQLDNQVRNNIPILFEQMLSKQQKSMKLPNLSLKSFGSINQAPKITLYELAIEQLLVTQVFQVPKEGCLTLAKVHLIKVYLSRYILELQAINSHKSKDNQLIQTKLLQIINSSNLFHVYEWILQHLKINLNIKKKDFGGQNSDNLSRETIENSRVSLTLSEKMLLLQMCELVKLIQSFQICKAKIVQYYNEHSVVLANLIKRLMTIQNNLIHLQTNKIVLSVIKPKGKQKSGYIPFDFARKLLFNTLIQLIDVSSIRIHVIEWASILLNLQNQHIFQNYEEQSEWEHIRSIIDKAKQIHIGYYALIQGELDCFYSQEKAISKYSHFLHDFTPIMVYQDKKQAKLGVIQKKLQTNEANSDIQLEKQSQEMQDGQSQQAELFFSFNKNYLDYDVNQLIQQL